MKLALKIVTALLGSMALLLILGAFALSMMGYQVPPPTDPTPDYMGRALGWSFIFMAGAAFAAMAAAD
jgi:hypothetical protein